MGIFFSIIIATKNPSIDLHDTLKSIIMQKNAYYEIIVIDSLSNYEWDSFFGDLRIKISRFISEKDTGIYNAWNKALKFCSGSWVIFLGEGDVFARDNILSEYEKNMTDSNLDYLYGEIEIMGNGGVIKKSWLESFSRINGEMPVPHVGMAHNINLFKSKGYFDERYKISGDYDFFIRTANKFNVKYLDGIRVANMKPGGVSAHPKFALLIIKENFLAIIRNKKNPANLIFIKNSIIHIVRYFKYKIMSILSAR